MNIKAKRYAKNAFGKCVHSIKVNLSILVRMLHLFIWILGLIRLKPTILPIYGLFFRNYIFRMCLAHIRSSHFELVSKNNETLVYTFVLRLFSDTVTTEGIIYLLNRWDDDNVRWSWRDWDETELYLFQDTIPAFIWWK